MMLPPPIDAPIPAQVVQQDKYDARAFKRLLDKSSKLQEISKWEKAEGFEWERAMQDIYAGLYKPRPKRIEEVPDNLEFQRAVMDEAEKLADWHELRKRTMLDEFASAIGTTGAGEKIREAIPPEIEKEAKKVQDESSKQNACKEMLKEMHDARQAGGGSAGQTEEQKKQRGDAINKAREARREKKKAKQTLQEMMQKKKGEIRQAVRGACQEAKKEIERADSFCDGFMPEPGSMREISLKDKLEVMQKIQFNDMLRQIAEKAGRFTRIALHTQETKTKHAVEEVVDIERGSDLGRVLPSELMLRSDPELETQFMRKFCDGELLQYKLDGMEKEGRGPLVVCVDNSGSMSGDRIVWAKAFALGLLTIAKKQRRTFAIVNFSDSRSVNSYKFDPTNYGELLDGLLEFQGGGGTDFQAALNRALKIIREDAKMNKADIVFVTDGQCSVDASFLKKYHQSKTELAFKCISVQIDEGGYSYGYGGKSTLEQFSDTVVNLNDVLKDDKVLESVYSL